MYQFIFYSYAAYRTIYDYSEIMHYFISMGEGAKYVYNLFFKEKQIENDYKYIDWILIIDDSNLEREF